MPIVEVAIVVSTATLLREGLAQELADACADVMNLPAGRLWLRLMPVSSAHYAENDSELTEDEFPVFVTVLHAAGPPGSTQNAEVAALSAAVAKVTDRPVDRVHIEYAPPGRGRMAFGGKLVE